MGLLQMTDNENPVLKKSIPRHPRAPTVTLPPFWFVRLPPPSFLTPAVREDLNLVVTRELAPQVVVETRPVSGRDQEVLSHFAPLCLSLTRLDSIPASDTGQGRAEEPLTLLDLRTKLGLASGKHA